MPTEKSQEGKAQKESTTAKAVSKTTVEDVPLTGKQERFCLEYMIDLNAKQAAIRSGYSEKTAKEIGSENLSKPNIQKKIQEMKLIVSEKLELTHEKILEELKNFAFSDITETLLLTVDELKELPPEVRRLIVRYKHTQRSFEAGEDKIITEDVIELWFVDKMKAFEMLNKHLGFYEKDNDQKKIDVVNVFKLPENDRD